MQLRIILPNLAIGGHNSNRVRRKCEKFWQRVQQKLVARLLTFWDASKMLAVFVIKNRSL
jgi:hypothetical protein